MDRFDGGRKIRLRHSHYMQRIISLVAVWSGDPKVRIFKESMNNKYWTGYKGPISAASGAVNADYVLVQMCASVATDAATPEAAAAEAERRAKRYFRRS